MSRAAAATLRGCSLLAGAPAGSEPVPVGAVDSAAAAAAAVAGEDGEWGAGAIAKQFPFFPCCSLTGRGGCLLLKGQLRLRSGRGDRAVCLAGAGGRLELDGCRVRLRGRAGCGTPAETTPSSASALVVSLLRFGAHSMALIENSSWCFRITSHVASAAGGSHCFNRTGNSATPYACESTGRAAVFGCRGRAGLAAVRPG